MRALIAVLIVGCWSGQASAEAISALIATTDAAAAKRIEQELSRAKSVREFLGTPAAKKLHFRQLTAESLVVLDSNVSILRTGAERLDVARSLLQHQREGLIELGKLPDTDRRRLEAFMQEGGDLQIGNRVRAVIEGRLHVEFSMDGRVMRVPASGYSSKEEQQRLHARREELQGHAAPYAPPSEESRARQETRAAQVLADMDLYNRFIGPASSDPRRYEDALAKLVEEVLLQQTKEMNRLGADLMNGIGNKGILDLLGRKSIEELPPFVREEIERNVHTLYGDSGVAMLRRAGTVNIRGDAMMYWRLRDRDLPRSPGLGMGAIIGTLIRP